MIVKPKVISNAMNSQSFNKPNETTIAINRFNWIERPGDDFPFYNGQPVVIPGLQWCFLMLTVAAGFATLFVPLPFFATQVGQFVPAILFFAIPLAGLALVAHKHWTTLFRRLRVMDFVWMIAFCILNFIVTLAFGLLLSKALGAEVNEAVAGVANLSNVDRVLFFVRAGFQLFGEEVLTILSFLGILRLFATRMRFSRTNTIIFAWLGSALIFALIHLSSYNWNVLQCILFIGTIRLVLTLPYIMTKNIRVCTGAHILNDYLNFSMTILGAQAG